MISSNNTLDRIQREIRESIQREKELKTGYTKINNGINHTTDNKNETTQENNNKIIIQNGKSNFCESNSVKNIESNSTISENGTASNKNACQKSNGFIRKFIPNSNANNKFVMQKFLKSRGKSLGLLQSSTQNSWVNDAALRPAKMTVEKGGKPLRNGFIPAEEKMKKELQDFQIRESELRQERRKSQPNLMAALNLEEENEFQNGGGNLFLEDFKLNGSRLKPAKSMANLYNGNLDFDDVSENNSSSPSSLKPARSLAELCDVSDDEVELPGTHSLIKQFESMKTRGKKSSK